MNVVRRAGAAFLGPRRGALGDVVGVRVMFSVVWLLAYGVGGLGLCFPLLFRLGTGGGLGVMFSFVGLVWVMVFFVSELGIAVGVAE